jgi:hypothetical protein
MSFFVSTYSLPKRGHNPHENQDAFRPLLTARCQYIIDSSSEWQQPDFMAAVADGATESMLSDIWARILVSRVSHLFSDGGLPSLINLSSSAWSRFKRRKASAGRSLTLLPAWLEEPGLEQGAFSTLVALRLAEDQTWRALAVGDSCLFHVRDNELLLQWPIQKSADFAKRPYLLCSEQGPSRQLDDNTRLISGQWSVDDHFFLMSDAIACWFERQYEKGEKPWLPLLNLGTDEAEGTFEELVAHRRQAGEMRNDDVTLIRVDVA